MLRCDSISNVEIKLILFFLNVPCVETKMCFKAVQKKSRTDVGFVRCLKLDIILLSHFCCSSDSAVTLPPGLLFIYFNISASPVFAHFLQLVKLFFPPLRLISTLSLFPSMQVGSSQ